MIYTVTFHRANNYGAMLQAFALQRFLLENNYSTEILDYDNKNISNSYKIFSIVSSNPLKLFYHWFFDFVFLKDNLAKKKNFDNYRKQIKLSQYFCNSEDIKNINISNSIFIVGSDQVWNPMWSNGIDDIYSLDFGGNNIKRISYAASCGKVSAIENNSEVFFKKLAKYNCISVREDSLKRFIEKNTDFKVDVVLDPSLLLKKEDWEKNISKERIIKEKYIFTYEAGNPNDLFYTAINKISKLTGLKIVYFGKNDIKNKYKCNKTCFYSAGPNEWLNLLYYSEFVVTTSFHGVALSTVLNKNLFVVLSTLPDRLLTLLTTMDLNDRVINTLDDVEKIYSSKIKWDKVNSNLDSEREKSSKWLINAIEECNNESK